MKFKFFENFVHERMRYELINNSIQIGDLAKIYRYSILNKSMFLRKLTAMEIYLDSYGFFGKYLCIRKNELF